MLVPTDAEAFTGLAGPLVAAAARSGCGAKAVELADRGRGDCC
jgi:hypothetical protein